MADRKIENLKNLFFLIIALIAVAHTINTKYKFFILDSFASVTNTVRQETPRNLQPMEQYTPAFARHEITVNNARYTYFWYEPEQPWLEVIKFPLVLVMHGAPGRSYAAKFLISGDIRTRYPAFILVPVLAAGHFWAMPDKFGGIKASALPDIVEIITKLSQLYPIDTSRIYAVGCSDGGTGVFGAARFFPDFFTAGAAISGAWDPEEAASMTKMPLWAIHGALDTVMPAAQAKAIIDIAKSRGGKAYYSELANVGHNCPSPIFYTDRLWAWLFKQG